MEKQQASKNSLPLEPALMNMILNPKYEKIRRPPNAFMLFARDHRRLMAGQHPNVCNKTVSTMLGKVWKSAPENVKSKYYKQAKMLGDLHKRRYPSYVYSPREARIQKMNKKKRTKEETNYIDSLDQNGERMADKKTTTKEEDNSNEEGCTTAVDPEYVPNNPGYFSSDMNSDDEQELDEQPAEYPMDFQYPPDTLNRTVEGWDDKSRRGQLLSSGICRCCDRSKSDFQEKLISPNQRPESERINSYYPDYHRCTYPSTAPFRSSPGPFSRPMSPYCCSTSPRLSPGLRPYGPPFHPYWNLPTTNSSYCPSREHVYENLKPYPTSYLTPDYFGHPFGYFDRHAAQFNPKPSYQFWPPLDEKPDKCQQEQNEHGISKDSESLPSFNRYINKGNNYCHSEVRNSTADEEMVLDNGRIVKTNIRNAEDTRNRNLGCGSGTRVHELANPHSSGPVAPSSGHVTLSSDSITLSPSTVYSRENHEYNQSQKEKNNEISANNFVSRQKYYPCVADNSDNKNEANFTDFCKFRAQVRSEEPSNYTEFSESNSNENEFSIHVQSEGIFNLPESSETNNNRNNLKNMYVADISPKLNKGSSSSFCDAPKINSWSTPVMKSDFLDNITQEGCNRSFSKLGETSISGSLQNNITDNRLSTNNLSAVARSNYTGHNQNNFGNNEYNHSMEMQYKAPNKTTMEIYSDLQNYRTQSNQKISEKELMAAFPISLVKIEDQRPTVYLKHTQSNSKPQNEVCNRESVEKTNYMKKMEKARIFPTSDIRDKCDATSNDSSNSGYNARNNPSCSFKDYLNSRGHHLSTIIHQEDECNEKVKMDYNPLKENSQFDKISMSDPKNISVNPTSTREASFNALHDSNQIFNKNPSENELVALKQVIKIETN